MFRVHQTLFIFAAALAVLGSIMLCLGAFIWVQQPHAWRPALFLNRDGSVTRLAR